MQAVMERIQEQLGEETRIFRGLLEVVERERDILLEGDHQELFEVSERKVGLCEQLSAVQDKRRALMAELAPEGAESLRLRDLTRFLDKEKQGPYKETVHGLTQMARRLENLNQNNKGFIEEALDMVDHLMAILTGGGGGGSYGAGGRPERGGGGRILAKEV